MQRELSGAVILTSSSSAPSVQLIHKLFVVLDLILFIFFEQKSKKPIWRHQTAQLSFFQGQHRPLSTWTAWLRVETQHTLNWKFSFFMWLLLHYCRPAANGIKGHADTPKWSRDHILIPATDDRRQCKAH